MLYEVLLGPLDTSDTYKLQCTLYIKIIIAFIIISFETLWYCTTPNSTVMIPLLR